MKSTSWFLFILILYGTNYHSFGQEEKHNLPFRINAEGFSFGIGAPAGWKGDLKNAAKYNSNIIFYTSMKDVDKGAALIQVNAFDKHDENTKEDLEYDIGALRKEHHNLKVESLVFKHKEFAVFSSLAYVDRDFYQYLTYINPGPTSKKCVCIAMEVSERRANEEELKAYSEIIASLSIDK